jgi:hypothetical protein
MLSTASFRKAEIQRKFGNVREMLVTLSPSRQLELYKDKEDCYFGKYPTLAELNMAYSPKAAQAWLVPQLTDLSEFCGAKGKLTENQLFQCAEIIVCDYYYLKVSELMLFFSNLKRCKYGQFYGAIDPMIILSAISEFLDERAYAYELKLQQDRKDAYNESVKNACSWEEHLRRTGQEHRKSPLERGRNESIK